MSLCGPGLGSGLGSGLRSLGRRSRHCCLGGLLFGAQPARQEVALVHGFAQGIGLVLVLASSCRPQGPAVQHDFAFGNLEFLDEEAAVGVFVHSRLVGVRPLVEGQGQLGAESGRQSQGEMPAHLAAGVEGQVCELGIRVCQVGDGRQLVLPQSGHHHRVLEPGRHGMAGVALGVDHGNLARRGSECRPESLGLCLGRSASGGGVGFMRHEHHVRGQGFSVQAQALRGPIHQAGGLLRDVLGLEAHGVVAAVCEQGFHDARHGPHTPAPGHVGSLHEQSRGSSGQDHSVASPAEGDGRLVQFLLGGGRTHGQESAADPGHELVGEHVFHTDDQDPFGPAQSDPVLGQRHRGGGGGTGRVHEEVGTVDAEQLGHGGMGQSEDLHQDGLGKGRALAGLLHEFQEPRVAGERGSHDHAGALRHGGMDLPSGAQGLAARGGLAVLGDGQPGVLEEFVGRGHRHPRGGVPAFVPVGGHGVFAGQGHLA